MPCTMQGPKGLRGKGGWRPSVKPATGRDGSSISDASSRLCARTVDRDTSIALGPVEVEALTPHLSGPPASLGSRLASRSANRRAGRGSSRAGTGEPGQGSGVKMIHHRCCAKELGEHARRPGPGSTLHAHYGLWLLGRKLRSICL